MVNCRLKMMIQHVTSRCIDIQGCFYIKMYWYTGIFLHQDVLIYRDVFTSRCIDIQGCFYIKMYYLLVYISYLYIAYLYISISLHLYIFISLYIYLYLYIYLKIYTDLLILISLKLDGVNLWYFKLNLYDPA